MTIALMLQKYLDAKNVRYDLMRHEPTSSSMETAEVCHVSGDCRKRIALRSICPVANLPGCVTFLWRCLFPLLKQFLHIPLELLIISGRHGTYISHPLLPSYKSLNLCGLLIQSTPQLS